MSLLSKNEHELARENSLSAPSGETVERDAAPSRCSGEDELGEAATILFVEDEAFVREVTAEVLRSAGYRGLTVKNAAAALRAYDQRRGEVERLLTDVVLPGETGRVLSGRQRRRNPRLKVLLVTGYADQMGLKETCHEECLAKPFSSKVLLQTVTQLFDRREFDTATEPSAMPASCNG